MARHIEMVCEQHPDRYECPDCLVSYSPQFREYGLIVHDGGSSVIGISYCPWCGSALPSSLRVRWFAELELLGIDPGEQPTPAAFESSAWWSGQDI